MLRWEEIFFQSGIGIWRPMFFRSLADTYLIMGRSHKGLAAVEHGLDGIRGKDYHEAELRRLRGGCCYWRATPKPRSASATPLNWPAIEAPKPGSCAPP